MRSKRPVMFVYWGRRGALPQFTLELARAVHDDDAVSATVSISRQSETFDAFAELGDALLPVDTFSRGAGALLNAPRIVTIRKTLAQRFATDGTRAVVELMPHVWSPFIMRMVRRKDLRYCPVIHDADAHPGDYTALVKPLLDRVISRADRIVTLSGAVTNKLVARGIPEGRIATLRHPDLTFGAASPCPPPAPGEPWRLLFLGRIMPYKGLPLLLDAIEALRGRGEHVSLGVYGDGDLSAHAERLAAIGATIVNRWLTPDELGAALASYHAVVLSHTEASQSGVAAAALGAGVPVIATPVGGLVEQIADGRTGVFAERVDADALADAVARLTGDRALYARICATIAEGAASRSMAGFVRTLKDVALGDGP